MTLDNIVYETAAKNGVDRICFASSACTYPIDIQQERQRLREDMVTGLHVSGSPPDLRRRRADPQLHLYEGHHQRSPTNR